MIRLLKIILPVFFALVLIQPISAQDKINLYFFYGNGCPHCAKEEKFLSKLEKERNDIKINRYEVWYNRDNAHLLSDLGKKLNLDVSGVPLLIIGNKSIAGYYSDRATGEKINEIINYYTINECSDVVESVLAENGESSICPHGCEAGDQECIHNCGCQADNLSGQAPPETINVPVFGEIKIKGISLPLFTILIAVLDGFNPCAMWVLLFLISLLLGLESRKKMWILGLTFIAASALVYFLFLAAWLNLFLFLGFIFWVRLVIGILAIGSGVLHLKEYFKNRKGTCPVTEDEKRRAWFERFKKVIAQEKFWLALIGIAILAAAVNLVELICSAGLPAIYTQVLSLSDLPAWQYYAYLVLYIFVFMLDDMLIFIIAMLTLKMKGISSRYSRWSNLIGGVIILIIGILLLFKPGWLMF
ncbi:MAG: hypothetical protein PHZ04_03950 [Patescibacteria group bacterium]|nr:hypothetical protein [Patescibacteria group bacterium]MDD5294333.1 hypothetical protein [Patescibacteria group bacterium]MDD5554050.1 hypothetical protein [Patescibacteria group bacterium]